MQLLVPTNSQMALRGSLTHMTACWATSQGLLGRVFAVLLTCAYWSVEMDCNVALQHYGCQHLSGQLSSLQYYNIKSTMGRVSVVPCFKAKVWR